MVFEFRCNNDHVTESNEHSSVRDIFCPTCGEIADRIISAPSIMLGTSTERWAKHHEKMARKQD